MVSYSDMNEYTLSFLQIKKSEYSFPQTLSSTKGKHLINFKSSISHLFSAKK